VSDKLSGAVEELEQHLKEQLEETANTKKLINSLLKRMGQEPRYPDVAVEHRGAIRPDEYYGKPLSTAIQMYLERRRQAVSAEEIMKGLEHGGFDFRQLNWSEHARLRNLVITMVKSSKTFHRLPNQSFGLTAWYDEAMLKKAERAAKDGEKGSEAQETSVEETEKAKSA
jgi:hypothetical protein